MATYKVIIFLAACVLAQAFPDEPIYRTNNTIFLDERLEGEIFEDIEAFENIDRSIAASTYRLPTTTRPLHYNVLWAIDISRLTFSGTVEIQLYATRANVSEIVIHADDLEITSVILRQGTVTTPSTYTLQKELQFLRLRLNTGTLVFNAASPVIYTLTIDFAAPLRTDMYGIYRTWFRNSANDVTRWMASTQFQATSARYAFPCYDEPSFKATFDITIRRPTTHRSWSCTNIRETRVSTVTGYQDDIYNRTPLMSTYLIALIVAEYESLEQRQNGVLRYEVIARPGALSAGQGQYAFDVGMELLATMSRHTAMDFYSIHPNLKMTQASIPDFSAGAMENWGLLTYREAYLMYDENHTNGYFKQLIAYILSHEIAHMWYGNLVTCDWWDVLWLNEGFARYYQYFLTDWVEDYMGLGTRFIVEQIHTSLLSDSANSPQPLTNPGVGSPASVSAMFSTISYNKGAAVIRMTEHFLGFEVHRQGLNNYLIERSFDTALPIHLFQTLEVSARAAGALSAYGPDFSFVDYYKSWTEQSGHPVLNVQVNHQTGDMTIYQRRFNINTGYSNVNTNYIVPITFATARNPNFANTKPTHVLTKAVTVINRGSVGDEWVIFNKQQTGFYRVNYDDYTWNLIVIALRGPQRTQIHEYNRAQIVNDVFQFARSGLMTYNRAFNILSFLENETEYAPWVAAITGFNWIRNRLVGTAHLTTLNNLIARWSSNLMNQLTYSPIPNESFMRSYLRYQLAPLLCNINVAACRTAATTQFQALRVNGQEVPVDNRNWVYCNALRDGTEADFNFLYQRFQSHNVYTEKIQILWVLGCTPHANSLNTLLNAIVQDNFIIRPQDYTNAFNNAVSGNEGNTQIAFRFIQNNLAAVTAAFQSVATPLSYVSSRLRTEAEIVSFQNWATQNQVALGDAYQAVFRGAETSRESIAWASLVQNDMNSYFVTGDTVYEASTAANVVVSPPTTVTPPNLVEPVTPSLPVPDAAPVSTFLSVAVVALAAVVNLIM
ncbi:membrane alanyl aminopeptidase-like [Bombyx mandarina]|uniref:Membrane alanyl aminopeptidase-like n=1 Tax=Bombyx mandarina TaxID=7092 RepID=A0A6J2K561_BOMMA|nr:membrane alanyl aminopeptidase-like [Bombyx mandarina]XP_028036122.1 membrane alanyl aminopeptidase-like [Bombyx mandarina]